MSSSYIGRFAPSPTGPLHFGSLLAALASYLDARSQGGKWLVRIEDLDPAREDPEAINRILQILDAYQLHWDDAIRYQSHRHDAYSAALQQLRQTHEVFPCGCSRKQLGGHLHNGICQLPEPLKQSGDYAWRFCVGSGNDCFMDGLQGQYCESLENDIGDFVVKRRDGLWSYQLAVVVDDADQNITHVVRGIDLIDSTIRQQCLQRALNVPVPHYSHVPVAIESNGQKLSKQNLALPLRPDESGNTLWYALLWLQQAPPQDLKGCGNATVLKWAVAHWNLQALSGVQEKPAPPEFLRHHELSP